jgi:hypothetical protein
MPSEFGTKQSQKSQQANLQQITTPCRERFHLCLLARLDVAADKATPAPEQFTTVAPDWSD